MYKNENIKSVYIKKPNNDLSFEIQGEIFSMLLAKFKMKLRTIISISHLQKI